VKVEDAHAALRRREDATQLAVYPKLPIAIARGEGSHVFDEDGRRYLDLYGAHAVALVGHSHPHVVQAVAAQAARLIYYSNVAYSRVRAEASELLLRLAGFDGWRVFFGNSGSEANETALKLARKTTGRRKVVSFAGGFHGRSLAALSATGIDRYRAGVDPLVAHHEIAPSPREAVERGTIDAATAAVIFEPIQSLGGMRRCDDTAAMQAAREVGALVVLDEVQTGLGRTGTFLYAHRLGFRPDLVTLAKGMAGGLPCSAVLVAPDVAARVAHGDQGSTFGGGPVAMAALKATLEVVEREGLAERARAAGERLAAGLRGTKGVREVRGAGLLLGVDVGPHRARDVQAELFARAIIAGTSDDPHTLRLLPPLTIADADIDSFLATLPEVLR